MSNSRPMSEKTTRKTCQWVNDAIWLRICSATLHPDSTNIYCPYHIAMYQQIEEHHKHGKEER